MKVNRKLAAVLAAVSVGLVGCSSINPGQQAVLVDSWGAPTVSDCAKEETMVSYFGNTIRLFPARQITWDANNDPGAERGPYTALSKPASAPPAPDAPPDPNFSTGQAEMAVPVTITFDLTTDCEKLKTFYRDYATQDSGWLNDDGGVSDGWKKLLTRVVSQPAEQAIIAVTQKYPWQKVWNDEEVRREYVTALQNQLPKESAARTGGQEYFTGFKVIVGKPYPTDQSLRDNVALIQTNQAKADAERIRLTAQANAEKAAAEAQQAAAAAQQAAEKAKADVTKAQIGAYPDIDAYLRAQCRENPTCHQSAPSPIIAGAR